MPYACLCKMKVSRSEVFQATKHSNLCVLFPRQFRLGLVAVTCLSLGHSRD